MAIWPRYAVAMDYAKHISDTIQGALDGGHTIVEIAEATGLHSSYVSQLLHQRRTPLVLKHATEIAELCEAMRLSDMVRRLTDHGYSMRIIAHETGLTVRAVSDLLNMRQFPPSEKRERGISALAEWCDTLPQAPECGPIEQIGG